MSDLEGLEQFVEKVAWRGNEAAETRRGRKGSALFPPAGFVHREAAAHPKREIARDTGPVEPPPASSNRQFSAAEVTSYTELIGGIQARLGELGIRQVDFDKLAGFPEGLTGKAFGPSQVKRLGPEKLFDAIRAAGLKLKLDADPEQLERMRKQIAENCQPRQAKQARMGNRSHLSNKTIDDVLGYLANQKGGLTRLNDAVKEARSKWARNAAKALWEKRRACGPVDFATYLDSVSQNGPRMLLPPPEQRDEEAAAA